MILIASAPGAIAQMQSSLWKQVKPGFEGTKLEQAHLSSDQLHAIGILIKKDMLSPNNSWDCDGNDLDEMIAGLTFEQIPLSPGKTILLANPGSGCARGGQGSNAAMWLIQVHGTTPALLASPQHKFSGWLFSIQPSISFGYRDLVLGWHMSADETDLTYFRFNGKSYVATGRAKDAGGKIAPNLD